MAGHQDQADTGGEVSLSVEETNKLRATLGLPPLKVQDDSAPRLTAEEERKKRKREEDDDAAKAAELEERVQRARERRLQQELLNKTQTLGAAADDVDDVMAWVSKTRKLQSEPSQARADKGGGGGAQRPATNGAARKGERREGEERGGEAVEHAVLAGMKVKHSFDDLEAGEEVVLTLEDKPILDDKGHVIDDVDVALENVRNRELRDREKAYANAKKAGQPLWEEDGRKRSLLDKYEEVEEEALRLDEFGSLEAAKLKRQEDIRAKLAAVSAAATAGAPNAGMHGGDYYTPEEAEAMCKPKNKPKKKKERRLKKKALTADELDALEMEAANANGAEGDLGWRGEREHRAAKRSSDFAATEAEGRSRFEKALAKANAASLALRDGSSKGADGGAALAEGHGDEEEEEADDAAFFASLNRAAAMARKKASEGGPAALGADAIAQQLARRREEEEKRALIKQEDKGVLFTEISEFARSIRVKEEDHGGDEEGGARLEDAGDETRMPSPGSKTAVKREDDVEVENLSDIGLPKHEDAGDAEIGAGGWVPAEQGQGPTADDRRAIAHGGPPATKRSTYRKRATTADEGDVSASGSATVSQSIATERAIGRGMAGALEFLKERGELNRPVEWAGRTSDSRDAYFTKAMGGFKDVYTGGAEEDQIAKDVEVALTRKDEHGRVLTPKEAWRRLCHDFHGNAPSRNTKERRAKQLEKELAQRKAATGTAEGDVLAGLKAVQRQAATPFVVLSGTVKPGQSREAGKGGGSDMPPPPPRQKG